MSGVAWHSMSHLDVLARLEASEAGLSPGEVAARQAKFGPNALPERRRSSGIRVFLRQFKSPLIYLLLVAAAIALALGERADAAVIVGVLLANAIVGAFQEGRAERSMDALRKLSALQARVRRGGEDAVVAARDLVPGDVLVLEAGDAVGADARLLEVSRLATLEGALTGESTAVDKDPRPCPEDAGVADRLSMVYAGTHVTAGRGLAVVVATGTVTEVGRIAALTEGAEEPATPLERRLAQLGPPPRHRRRRRVPADRRGRDLAGPRILRGPDGGAEPARLHRPGRVAGGDHRRAGGGDAAHGEAGSHRPATGGRGVAGFDDRHLHRQDRDPHPERDDRRGRLAAGRPHPLRRRLRPRTFRRDPARRRADPGGERRGADRGARGGRPLQRRPAPPARRRGTTLARHRRPHRGRAARAGAPGRRRPGGGLAPLPAIRRGSLRRGRQDDGHRAPGAGRSAGGGEGCTGGSAPSLRAGAGRRRRPRPVGSGAKGRRPGGGDAGHPGAPRPGLRTCPRPPAGGRRSLGAPARPDAAPRHGGRDRPPAGGCRPGGRATAARRGSAR